MQSSAVGIADSALGKGGQTTVPDEILAVWQAAPGTRLTWTTLSHGTVLVRAKTKMLADVAGMFTTAEPVNLEDMNPEV